MAKLASLDQKDRDILRVIQAKGRIPVVDLAEEVNLTKSPCLQRLRRLEQQGYITGYRAVLDPHKIEQGYLVYVQIKLDNTGRKALENFNKAVLRVPEILACHMLSGGYDYLLKIRCANMKAFRELLGDEIADLPHVNQTMSFPVMEEVKETTLMVIQDVDE